MLNGANQYMTVNDFNAKYSSNLQEKYQLIGKAVKAGNREEGRRLVSTLSSEEKLLFREYQKDVIKVSNYCDARVEKLESQKAEIITQFSTSAAQAYKDYTIPSSNSSSRSTQPRKSNGFR